MPEVCGKTGLWHFFLHPHPFFFGWGGGVGLKDKYDMILCQLELQLCKCMYIIKTFDIHTLWKSVLTVKLKVWLIVNKDLVMVPLEGRGHAYGWSYVHIYSELDSLRMVCLCQSVAPLWSGEKKTKIKITYLTVCLCTLCKSFSSLGYIHSTIFPPFCHPVRSPDVILCGWLGSKHQLTN